VATFLSPLFLLPQRRRGAEKEHRGRFAAKRHKKHKIRGEGERGRKITIKIKIKRGRRRNTDTERLRGFDPRGLGRYGNRARCPYADPNSRNRSCGERMEWD
jgi:hypothetical protein